MSKHTPGPWHHYRYSGLVPALHIIEPLTRGVTMQMSLHGATDADARLIAAAPELLAALNQAAAALAVVANHTKHPGCADPNNINSVRGFALEAFRQARAAIAKAAEATR